MLILHMRWLGLGLWICMACAVACGGDDAGDAPDDGGAPCVPVGPEVCDGEHRDEDCDPSTFGELDRDDDGVIDSRCCNSDADGELRCGSDCHDLADGVHPGAEEICDDYDNDCDGRTDEDVTVTRYRDADGDGHGSTEALETCDGKPGTAASDDDCDDGDAMLHPGMPELCDERDNDCDGAPERPGEASDVVWYLDGDGDGFGVSNGPIGVSCAPPPFPVLCLEWLPLEFCTPGDPVKFPIEGENKQAHHHQDGVLDFSIVAGDCDDIDPFVYPGAEEICNGRDDDCDGRDDYRLATNDFEDDDGDRVVDATCERRDRDCDDMNASSAPGREEICDGFDSDCDGTVDEALTATEFFVDRDGDGYGDASRDAVSACGPLVGYATIADDCDDRDPTRHPDLREACDAIDQDCDGHVDEQIGGCAEPTRVTGTVSRADDPAMVVEGALVTAYDVYGSVIAAEPTRASGRFDLEVPAGPVVISVEPDEASGLVGLVRAMFAPATGLRVPLDPGARWDAIARASGVERDPRRGIFVAEIEGTSPIGGQGVLIAPGGGHVRARVGDVTVESSALPAYGPPLFAPAGQPFASVSHYDLAPGLHNPMLTEVLACHPYAVTELSTAPSPAGRMLRVVSYPVLPGAVTLMRVDCSVALDTCCSAWGGTGCRNEAVETCVCAREPSCCASGWDEACAELVTSSGCSTCSSVVPHGGACCLGGDLVGCATESIESCVCRVLPECCQGPWDQRCAGAISTLRCGYCPGGFNGTPEVEHAVDAGMAD